MRKEEDMTDTLDAIRPTRLDEIVGNSTLARRIDDLFAADRGGGGGMRILVCGPEGSGKSTATRLLASERGLVCFDVDASDCSAKTAAQFSQFARHVTISSFASSCAARALVCDNAEAADRTALSHVRSIFATARANNLIAVLVATTVNEGEERKMISDCFGRSASGDGPPVRVVRLAHPDEDECFAYLRERLPRSVVDDARLRRATARYGGAVRDVVLDTVVAEDNARRCARQKSATDPDLARLLLAETPDHQDMMTLAAHTDHAVSLIMYNAYLDNLLCRDVQTALDAHSHVSDLMADAIFMDDFMCATMSWHSGLAGTASILRLLPMAYWLRRSQQRSCPSSTQVPSVPPASKRMQELVQHECFCGLPRSVVCAVWSRGEPLQQYKKGASPQAAAAARAYRRLFASSESVSKDQKSARR
jgi:hypothetical protein